MVTKLTEETHVLLEYPPSKSVVGHVRGAPVSNEPYGIKPVSSKAMVDPCRGKTLGILFPECLLHLMYLILLEALMFLLCLALCDYFGKGSDCI